ncbi:MAG: hypothetical protein H7Y22_11515, partial [Gemmatimonadaceae bacterium]|nr:hypothetical protein [Gloeobacterales cyanobacterium ES-bin-141]
YFAVTPAVDQYTANAQVQAKASGRNAIYNKGGITFSANVATKAPATSRDGEPSLRTDFAGNTYAAGIRGVPAGIDLWYFDLKPSSSTFDPKMRVPVYRGQPDGLEGLDTLDVGADGGGDVDLAVGFANGTSGNPTLAYSSLVAANISTGNSTDLGQTFNLNPLGNLPGGVPGDDRQWLEFVGPNTVYLFYRTLAPAVTMIQRSDDGGFTYGPTASAGTLGQAGSIDVDKADGTVYISGSTGQVAVGIPPIDPLTGKPSTTLAPVTYTTYTAATDPNGVDHIFFVVKVADDAGTGKGKNGKPYGTVYVCYSNDKSIFIAHSLDKGKTWSKPVRVSDGSDTVTSVLPWFETGPVFGSVGVVWYGTTASTNSDAANWNVFYTQTFNATANTPTFRQAKASDHIVHGSNISEGGTLGNANRNLLDYFQIAFDPQGAAVIAYTDDHNDFDGHTFVTRQTSGSSIKGSGIKVPTPVEGANLEERPPAPSDGSQVVDFARDVEIGLVTSVEEDDPVDILAIKYGFTLKSDGKTLNRITARMKVSQLPATLPPSTTWRMNFSANTVANRADPGVSPAQDVTVDNNGEPYTAYVPYTFGVSDRGDQFWVSATTDVTGVASYSYGKAVRNPDGTLTYTRLGAADAGAFDTTNRIIRVEVSADKLNTAIPSGRPKILAKDYLAGLRGEAFGPASSSTKYDQTRGGSRIRLW